MQKIIKMSEETRDVDFFSQNNFFSVIKIANVNMN